MENIEQSGLTEDECNDEERNTEEDGHSSDDVDEMSDLFGDWCLSGVDTRGQPGDPSHDRVIGAADHDPLCGS